MTKVFTFNVRETSDRIVYVEARNLKEAWSKARGNEWKDASDPDHENAKMTVRRLPDE